MSSFLDNANNAFKQSKSSIKGLNPALLTKLGKSQVIPSLENVLADAAVSNAASTKSVSELNGKLNVVDSRVSSLIDDTSTSGTDSTWSVDAIKKYISEVDDTYLAANLDERDDDTVGQKIPKVTGTRVFVVDASADSNVGSDKEGNPFGADYIYNEDSWLLIRARAYKQIDLTPFVKKEDVVDGLESTATQKPLSANSGRILAEQVKAAAAAQVIYTDDTTVKEDDDGNARISFAYVSRGTVVNGMAYVLDPEKGLLPVFVETSGDGKYAIIIADEPDAYFDKDCRVSYLTVGEVVEEAEDDSSDDDDDDAETA